MRETVVGFYPRNRGRILYAKTSSDFIREIVGFYARNSGYDRRAVYGGTAVEEMAFGQSPQPLPPPPAPYHVLRFFPLSIGIPQKLHTHLSIIRKTAMGSLKDAFPQRRSLICVPQEMMPG
jgi:hypothetical protein